MTDSLVTVDCRDDTYIVYWFVLTDTGWVMPGGFSLLSSLVDHEVLGDVVLHALRSSIDRVVPVSLEQGVGFKAMLRELRAGSAAKYSAAVRSVAVSRERDVVRVIPKEYRGPRGGFVRLSSETVVLAAPNAATLGAAVVDAVAKAR